MTPEDYFSGSAVAGFPTNGTGGLILESEFLLKPYLPRPGGLVAPVTITSYDISQLAGGDGVGLVFYDQIALPPDGTPLFGNADPTLNPLFVVPIVPGGVYHRDPPGGHTYQNGFGVILNEDTTWATVARGTLFGVLVVHYIPHSMSL